MVATGDGRPNCFQCKWDVCVFCEIYVERERRPAGGPVDREGHRFQFFDGAYRWSATLAYSKTPDDPTYRWREVSFWTMAISRTDEPFYLPASDREFDLALSSVLSMANVAFGPKTIDGEDEDEFRNRWSFIIGQAATGTLSKPSNMPIQQSYFSIN
jgi:hypothetical protein